MLRFAEEDYVGNAMQIPKLWKAAIMNTAYLNHQIIQDKVVCINHKTIASIPLVRAEVFTKHLREDNHCARMK